MKCKKCYVIMETEDCIENNWSYNIVKIGGNEQMRNKRGITLIALVITVIVMLIIAGVAISAITANGVPFGKMQEAADKYNKEAQKEGETLNSIMEIMENSVSEETTLAEMYKNGLNCDVENCNSPDHLHIGDYVEYKNPTSGTYISPASKTGIGEAQTFDVSKNQLNWRVLGYDEVTGGVKLIAGSPMKSNAVESYNDPYFYMYGSYAYEYGIGELTNICKLYETEYLSSARSVTLEDINEITGVTTEEKIKEANPTYGEAYKYEDAYSPASWIDGKKRETIEGNEDGYYYEVNLTGIAVYDLGASLTVTVANKKAEEMLFDNVEIDGGKCYYLASRGVWAGYSYATYGISVVRTEEGMTFVGDNYKFRSSGFDTEVWCGVRPVVILKSSVTETQVPKSTSDKVEERWEYEM